MIDVRCCSIVDRAFAIEALRTIRDPKKRYALRKRPALGAVAFDLLDDGWRKHIDALEIPRPPIVGDRLERVPARPDEGERLVIERDGIVAKAPVVEAREMRSK
jgi:hypothetical protein